ncbi:MFS general substrate transporter [Aaosphaeria arxii CBS 175.79]|uniref:MFS general substrate transporter n=1 Tax=Aaosphaeria arxii CBS 175.79 TaxID=1450172 RepID=A0A6A5XYD1_9PLEO|nr:MFS general substrate transporter [Aaosphaeria arxii CBS 175.79]KAF2018172.1 MFS general substrate transporter [Aaosphaeria arxii CBS 175.79]
MADKDLPTHEEKIGNNSPATSINEEVSNRDWTPEEERKLVWKIDFRVFPMLCFVFGLSLLDRTNISAAYIAGLAEDLRLDIGSRYSIALLVFFIGYAIFELPSNYVIRRIGARWWLSFLIIAWGCCVLGMGFVNDWKALTVLRAFLGVFEAGLFPGSVFIIGSWYRQFETARRVSIFYMASLLASGFGPIFAYALSLIRVGDGMYRSGWRWIFIIEGIVTIVAGLVSPFFLIEFPERVTFLTPRQKHIAITRVRQERENTEVVHPTAKESLKMLFDWKIGVYSIQYFISASSVYSLAFFKPIILRQGMGFDYAKAQLLSSPPYVFAIICSLGMAYLSDKLRIRWPVMCFQALMAIVGLLIILYAGPPGVRYFGLYLAIWGTQANIPGTLAYGQNQTAKPEKKGVVAAAMISVGAAGGICGSTIFRSQDAPMYLPGMWATISMQILHIILTFCMSLYFKRQNKLADEGHRPALEGVEGFRYAP